MTKMFTLLAVLLVAGMAAAGKKSEPAEPANPNEAVAKTYGNKIWFQAGDVSESNGEELLTWLRGHHSLNEITRGSKGGVWSIKFLAVFKKPAAAGPMTVQIAEKKSPKEVVDIFSLPNPEKTFIFRSSHDFDPERGFNAGTTYLIKVGQIIKNQFVSYASGDLTLK